MSDDAGGIATPDDLRAAYEQVCVGYHAIDSFRAKLLGFLPLVSGTGLFFLLDDALVDPGKARFAGKFLAPVGIFGVIVTLGLFAYEIYGIRRCAALIETGKRLEESMQVAGHFRSRPHEVAGLINEPFAAGIIYPAVLAAWTYLALVFTLQPSWTAAIAGLVFLLGFSGSVAYDQALRHRGGKAPAVGSRPRAAEPAGTSS